jgi:redox-sensitive bicupin YhaK (pirin superfamily)
LPAQRGLRQKNLLRGAADVALLGHGHEVTQLSEFHPRSIIRMQAQAKNLALARSARSEHRVLMKTTETILNIRRANERGHADHGWLNSHHTFSFADYYDPAHMGFRSLRVINDDRVAPGNGFGTHPHRDMEIFSYVLEGALQHKDSMGNGSVLKPGQIQLMSAGSGVTHSEFNPSGSEPLHFLQIWIQPRERGLTSSYTEWRPKSEQADAPKVLVISPDGRDGSATIHQDAAIYRIRLQPGQTVKHELKPGRGAWLQIAEGALALNGVALATGDGASTEEPGTLKLSANARTDALLFDLG